MERVIKFRCWSVDNKEMYLPDEDYCFKVYNNSVGFYPHYYSNELSCFNTNPSDGELKIEVMQFTGLTDKNGVEIYEGDIFGSSEILRSVIEREDNGAYVLRFLHPKMKGRTVCILHHLISKSPIIGNIYANPELLTPPAPSAD